MRFLEEVRAENFTELALWEQHPELDGIVGTMTHRYHEIAARALDNEYKRSLGRADEAQGPVVCCLLGRLAVMRAAKR